MNEQSTPDPEATTAPSHVVAIGASAGGLEPLEQFFQAMPVDSGMAFVVLQHLSPNFKSLMGELLGRHTELTIRRAEDKMRLEPNCVYLNPPRMDVTVGDGCLRLADQDRVEGTPQLPIDKFFHSLASAYGAKAIGIVMSGTGSDGSRGIQAIKEAGGLTVVQDQASAKFDGMPRSSIDTGAIDIILPPDAMPGLLLDYRDQPEAARTRQAPDENESGFDQIIRIMRDESGIDFAQYKPSTVNRRIARRVQMSPQTDLQAYADRLLADLDEVHELYKDLLIGVTRFFRDREAFEKVREHVLAPMFADRKRKEIRVWVAGCATGEEAYSIAILLHEMAAVSPNPPRIRIFATDAHRASLETATTGRYRREALVEMTPERLNRYFTAVGDQFQVAPELRAMITFAPQNLTSDAPFTRIDLVTCRNLLIYLKVPAQQHVMDLFHFALNVGGVMFLGPSETISHLEGEFATVDTHWRIYRKRREIRRARDKALVGNNLKVTPPRPLPAVASRTPGALTPEPRLLRAYDILLNDFVPAGMLLNERRELVHTFGDARDFLAPPTGRVTLDVLEMVDPSLKVALGAAIQRAQRSGESIRYQNVTAAIDDEKTLFNLTVRPLPDRDGESHYNLVVLAREEVSGEGDVPVAAPARATVRGPDAQDENYNAGELSREKLGELETELQYTKENLQTTIEEMETSNEELNATNEELIASNEELQSTNEELHSVNEELYTVNSEYQRKITELTELTSDVNNLLSSTDIGVVFLDRTLAIRKFTAAAARYFRLRDQDLERPLSEISHRFNSEQLLSDAEEVLAEGNPIERAVHDREGLSVLTRALPYRGGSGEVEGVVLTVVDTSTTARVEAELKEARVRFEAFMHHSPALCWAIDENNHFVFVNPAFARRLQLDAATVVGKHPTEVMPSATAELFITAANEANRRAANVHAEAGADQNAEAAASEFHLDVPIGDVNVPMLVAKFPFLDAHGHVLLGAAALDVSSLRSAEAERDKSRRSLRLAARAAEIGLWEWDVAGDDAVFNDQLVTMLGYAPGELKMSFATWTNLLHPDDAARAQLVMEKYLVGKTSEYRNEFRLRTKNNDYCWVLAVGEVTQRTLDGQPQRMAGTHIKIDALKKAQQALEDLNADLAQRVSLRTAELAESESRFLVAADAAPLMMGLYDDDGRNTWCNQTWLTFTGRRAEDLADDGWLDVIHPDDRRGVENAWKVAVAEHSRFDAEYRARRDDGEYRWVQAQAVPRQEGEGPITGFVGTAVDITARKEAADELSRSRATLEQRVIDRTHELQENNVKLAARNAELDQFAHAASHDLRSPLRSILGYSELLRDQVEEGETEEAVAALNRISGAAERMGRLIDSLLDFASAGRGDLQPEKVDLVQLCETVTDDLAPEIQAADARVTFDELPTLHVDRIMLQRALQNLIGNAVKYRRDDVTPRVRIFAEERSEGWVIGVADNGVGLPAEQADLAFAPFQRLHAGQRYRGTGIGLSIVQRVIERHKGRVWVESKIDEGSTFYFSLPTA